MIIEYAFPHEFAPSTGTLHEVLEAISQSHEEKLDRAINFLLEAQLVGITLRDLRTPQSVTGKAFLRKHFPGVIILDVRVQ